MWSAAGLSALIVEALQTVKLRSKDRLYSSLGRPLALDQAFRHSSRRDGLGSLSGLCRPTRIHPRSRWQDATPPRAYECWNEGTASCSLGNAQGRDEGSPRTSSLCDQVVGRVLGQTEEPDEFLWEKGGWPGSGVQLDFDGESGEKGRAEETGEVRIDKRSGWAARYRSIDRRKG